MAMLMKKDCGKLKDSSCCNPPLNFDSCQNFSQSWSKICNRVPEGIKGNGAPKVVPPYGYTPFRLPDCPYYPKTTSLARPPWEGWRYGENFMRTEDIERPYGWPDWHYYRKNYCGPCCSCVCESMPGGDPDGKNPNIRYVQLDYKNLLGSGFAKQEPPQSQTSPFLMNPPEAATSCGQNHCPECSGVYKKKEQPVKFQVCIGNPCEPETVQPCPNQPMKIYLPLSMLPRGGPDGDKADDDEDCGDDDEEEGQKPIADTSCQIPGTTCGSQLQSDRHQQFEVTIPGECTAYHGGRAQCCWPPAPVIKKVSCNNSCSPKKKVEIDPCGCCKACMYPPKFCTPTKGLDAKKCQIVENRKPRISFSKPQLPCARTAGLASTCQ